MIPLVFLVLFCGLSRALHCNITVSPVSYISFPTLYDSVSVINPTVSGCDVIPSGLLFECDYSVVLGDGAIVPSPPNLSSSAYLRHFIAWKKDSNLLYVDWKLNESVSVTAVEISFLNYPARSISLPYIELLEVQYGSNLSSNITSTITSRLLGNNDLTQSDKQIRTVTLQPQAVSTALTLRLQFQFRDLHDFDWILVSEVRICSDTVDTNTSGAALLFQTPHSHIVQPSAHDLRGGATELKCTLSSEGWFTWQWERNSSVLDSGDVNYSITVGDASRTTKLIISNLDFSFAGQYACTATSLNQQHRGSLTQEIQFPEVLITSSEVSGYQQATLSCELQGYQLSFSPPMWLWNGSELTTSAKYTVNLSVGESRIVSENGSSLSSVIVNLTIHNLTTADEGNYTCHGTREESTTQLIVRPEPVISSITVTSTLSYTMSSTGRIALPTQAPSTVLIISSSSIPYLPLITSSRMTSSTAMTPSSSNEPTPPPPSPVLAVGAVVGGLVVVCVVTASLVVAVWCVRRKSCSKDGESEDTMMVYEVSSQLSSTSTVSTQLNDEERVSTGTNPVYKVINHNLEESGKSAFEQSTIFFYSTDL